MKRVSVISCTVMLLAIGSAIAAYRPTAYSMRVMFATQKQKNIPKEPVYVGPSPWIKNEGAYSFASNRTIKAIVDSAGGFTRDKKVMNNPLRYVNPDVIRIFRPTKEHPDPRKPMVVFFLDWSKPNGGVSNLTFVIQSKDYVDVRPKWTLDENDASRKKREQSPGDGTSLKAAPQE
jgi:hypothetical protein